MPELLIRLSPMKTGSGMPHPSPYAQGLAWCLAHTKINKYIVNELTKEKSQSLEANPKSMQTKTQDIEIWKILNSFRRENIYFVNGVYVKTPSKCLCDS